MKTSFSVIFLSATILCGCGHLFNDPDWIEEKMYSEAAELPPGGQVGEPINFIVTSYFGDDCWQFSRFKIVPSGLDVHVTPYAKRLAKETICATVITAVSGESRIIPVVPGEYRFHFWQSDTQTLDYTVIVQ